MAEATAEPTGGVRSTRPALALLGLVVVAVVAVALASWIAGLERSPGWSGAVLALVTAGAIASVLTLTKRWSDHLAWMGVVGLVLVAVGSGIGRPRVETFTGQTGTQSEGGEVIARLDTWWPLVGAGLAVGVAALVWSLVATREGRRAGLLATGSLLVMAVGYVAVVVATKDLVVGQWVSGRPIRRGRRTAMPRADRCPRAGAAELWLDAAEDEAAAATAFSDLATRLGRVGAPPGLIERCHRASREEERHEQACRRLAHDPSVRDSDDRHGCPVAIGTSPRTPGTRIEVVRLAVESFVDGVVGEGFAARRLEAGALTVERADRAVIRSMAVEEDRHAVLGADIVRWALDAHPLLVGAALRNAARRLPDRIDLPIAHRRFTPADLRRVGLVDAGRASELWSQQRTAARGWLEVTAIEPTRRLVGQQQLWPAGAETTSLVS